MATRSKKNGKGRQKSKAAQLHAEGREDREAKRFERSIVEHPDAVDYKHAHAPDKVFVTPLTDEERKRRGVMAVVVMGAIIAAATSYMFVKVL